MDVEWDIEHVNRRTAIPFASNSSQHSVCLALDDLPQETCMERPSLDIDLHPALHDLRPGCHQLVAWLQDASGVATSSVGRTFFEVVEGGVCRALNCAKAVWDAQQEMEWLELQARPQQNQQECEQ
jgi:hypothetical protein